MVVDLAEEFERRAEQYELALDDFENADVHVDDVDHSRDYLAGKRDAYQNAADDLRDQEQRDEEPTAAPGGD